MPQNRPLQQLPSFRPLTSWGGTLPNKPLKLSAASLSYAVAVLDTNRTRITRGRSLAARRWAAGHRSLEGD